MSKAWKKVDVVRNVSVSPEPGIFTSVPTVVYTSYIMIAPARSNIVYNATIREQSVTHEGWARTNDKWVNVEVGDTLNFGTRSLRVVLINEEGEISSRWLHFELDEKSLKEIESNG